MELSLFSSSDTSEIIELFTNVFSASENEPEGQVIGNLVSDLIATTNPQDLIGCVAISNDGNQLRHARDGRGHHSSR